MANHKHDLLAGLTQSSNALSHERGPDLPALMIRQNGHRRECHGVDIPSRRANRHACEEDVTDDALLALGDQRRQDASIDAQAIDEVGFIRSSEGEDVDLTNGLAIGIRLGSNQHAYWIKAGGGERCAAASGSLTRAIASAARGAR